MARSGGGEEVALRRSERETGGGGGGVGIRKHDTVKALWRVVGGRRLHRVVVLVLVLVGVVFVSIVCVFVGEFGEVGGGWDDPVDLRRVVSPRRPVTARRERRATPPPRELVAVRDLRRD